MTTYSDFWRKNRSGNETAELMLCLRALRKVAGYIGRNVKPVFWKGMVETDNRFILLDPGMAKEKYPVSFDTFDALVGQVVLEGLSSLEWREWVIGKVQEEAPAVSDSVYRYLENVIEAAEDIYINMRAESSVWSLYLVQYWRLELEKNRRDPTLPPAPSSLADIWRAATILDEHTKNLHAYYYGPLEILSHLTDELSNIALLASITERRSRRKDVYMDIWGQVAYEISEWEEFQISPDAINFRDEAAPRGETDEGNDEDENKDTDESNQASADPEDLLNRLKAALEDGENDLTDVIAVAVEEPEAKSMETIVRKSQSISDFQPDEMLVNRLKKIFLQQQSLFMRRRKRHIKKAQYEGKIDPRRLYRVPMDSRVFKKKELIVSDFPWHVCIIADASSSMGGKSGAKRPWETAEKFFVSLAHAAAGFKNLIDIYAYSEDGAQCVLTQLYSGGKVYSVIPKGRTPSGQAIMAAAMMLNKKYKNSMIIHITDGAANCGLSLGDTLKYCRAHDVEVFTIGCGCNLQTQQFLKGYFPSDHLNFMDNISGLSEVIEKLFRQKMLKI
ncbi:MAG: VWA domain-containing protein [Desulfobacteraceae bacterium]|nr:MAG: VWA domain-containing protein [Desulfobacteraceae bacterium]